MGAAVVPTSREQGEELAMKIKMENMEEEKKESTAHRNTVTAKPKESSDSVGAAAGDARGNRRKTEAYLAKQEEDDLAAAIQASLKISGGKEAESPTPAGNSKAKKVKAPE